MDRWGRRLNTDTITPHHSQHPSLSMHPGMVLNVQPPSALSLEGLVSPVPVRYLYMRTLVLFSQNLPSYFSCGHTFCSSGEITHPRMWSRPFHKKGNSLRDTDSSVCSFHGIEAKSELQTRYGAALRSITNVCYHWAFSTLTSTPLPRMTCGQLGITLPPLDIQLLPRKLFVPVTLGEPRVPAWLFHMVAVWHQVCST